MKLIKVDNVEFKFDDIDYELIKQLPLKTRNTGDYTVLYFNSYVGRFLLGLKDGDGMVVDHKNGDHTNFTRNNLRKCTRSENQYNRSKCKGKASKYKGVIKGANGKWRVIAYERINGKRIVSHLYTCADEILCAQIWNYSAHLLHGEFARFNNVKPLFPPVKWYKEMCIINYKHGFGKSKYRGVDLNKNNGKWRAQICCDRIRYNLGDHETPELAAQVYNYAADVLHKNKPKFMNKVDPIFPKPNWMLKYSNLPGIIRPHAI